MAIREPRILIINSNIDQSNILLAILEQQHFEAKVASELKQAIVYLREYQPSLVFLDYPLPNNVEFDVIPTIHFFNEKTKVVVISADVSEAIKQTPFGEDGFYFLSKPISPQSVSDVMAAIR